MYYIYRHVRLDTNMPFYIGKGTVKDCENGHVRRHYRAFSKDGRNNLWKRIVNKHGYRVDIIFYSDSESFIYEKECEFIKIYGRLDFGLGTLVNFTDGGDGESGRIFSDIHKKRISISKTGIKPNLTDECLLRKSKRISGKNNMRYGIDIKGEKNPMWGRKHKEETKKN